MTGKQSYYLQEKKNPFKVVYMTSNDLFSTKSLEKQITNRKTDVSKGKVEWLKMQWLNYKKEQPFNFNCKFSNDPECPFDCNYIGKRNSKVYRKLYRKTISKLKTIQKN